jgi:tol-pal system protein YbgF
MKRLKLWHRSALVVALSIPFNALSNTSTESRILRLERIIDVRIQSQVDMQQELDRMTHEVATLRGLLESQTHQMEQVLKRQRNLYNQMNHLTDQKTTNNMRPEIEPELSAEEAYEYAVNLVIKENNYKKARIALEQFMQNYKHNEYTDNALYWLGQLQFSESKLETAEATFNQLIAKYPQSNKLSDSLFKLGLIAEKKGDIKVAKTTYRKVISDYPKSSSARLAQVQISALKEK